MTRLRLGTRQSALALAQSGQVARALEKLHPGLMVELVPVVTLGDTTPGDLSALGGKGLFTEELESGLINGTIDLAVHSLKDLPTELDERLEVAAYPTRVDPRDALVSHTATNLDELSPGDRVLTGSLRRRSQILDRRPDVIVEAIRGNVDTRLRKWTESGAAAVVLAAAGLERLGITDIPAHPLDPMAFIPAPGQGTLALEVAKGGTARDLVAAFDDPSTRATAEAERRLVSLLGGDCTLPLGAYARWHGDELAMIAVLATIEGEIAVRAESRGHQPIRVADECFAALEAAGASRVLETLA